MSRIGRTLLGLAVIAIGCFPVSGQNLAIRYEGAWTNLTFGSVGQAWVDVALQAPDATLKFNLDGFVFGTFDPPLITIPGTVQDGLLTFDAKGVAGFGDITGSVNIASGATLINVTNVPNAAIKKVQLTGTITTRLDLQYVVDFNGAPSPTNPARGVIIAEAIAPLQIIAVEAAGGQLTVRWTGGKPPYQLEATSALGGTGDWQKIGAATTVQSGQVPITVPGNRWVRVRGQ